MLGTSLNSYAKNVLREVISVGRAGSLIDWESENENRVYVSAYAAKNILNWRVERIHGRNVPTMVVLLERGMRNAERGIEEEDPFEQETTEQIRVLRLAEVKDQRSEGRRELRCVVELWQRAERKSKRDRNEWRLVDSRIPLRLSRRRSRFRPLPRKIDQEKRVGAWLNRIYT